MNRISRYLWTAAVTCAVAVPCAARTPAAIEIVVAQDGSGQFKTVQEAVMSVPAGTLDRPVVIRIRPGIYKELIYVQREKRFFRFIGENAETTVLTHELHANLIGLDGKPIGTFRTPSTVIDADDFVAENITFENAAGPKGQALAIRVDGDRATFRKCRFLGWQDTIFLNRGRHYFEDCYITGHVDFIFGGAMVFFERCHVHARGTGYITASSAPDRPAVRVRLRQRQDHGRYRGDHVSGPSVARLFRRRVREHRDGQLGQAGRLAQLGQARTREDIALRRVRQPGRRGASGIQGWLGARAVCG